MTNIARFTINGSASTNGGVDVANNAAVTLALEASPGVVAQRVVYSVYDSSDVNSPLASKNAPTLTLDNGAGSTGQSVQASTPNASVTTTAPASGQHSYLIRCTVNGGVNSNGVIDSDYVFERMLSIRSGANLRKIVHGEGTAYSQRSEADAQNELVDAYATAIAPQVDVFTATDTWTKPANALHCDFVVVGPGGDGGDGGTGTTSTNGGGGGGGGGAGEVVHMMLDADSVPSSLTVTIASGYSALTDTNIFQILASSGSDGGDASGGTAGSSGSGAQSVNGGAGGNGTSGTNGAAGSRSQKYGAGWGGAGGNKSDSAGDDGYGGNAGYGYGAGGGGGGGGYDDGAAYYAGGGGGGAGGYGNAVVASNGADGSSGPGLGGAGALGIIVITTWCGV